MLSSDAAPPQHSHGMTRAAPTGKAESILAAARREFLAERLRRGQHGRDRARGRRLEGDGLRPFRRQGGTVRRRRRAMSRALFPRLLGERARPARRRGVADRRSRAGFSIWCCRPTRSRSTASSSARSRAFRRSARCSGAPGRSAPGSRSRPSCAAPTAAGTLALADPRLAAEQFVALVRGEIHLRQPAAPRRPAPDPAATRRRRPQRRHHVPAGVRNRQVGGARLPGLSPGEAKAGITLRCRAAGQGTPPARR